MFQLLLLSYLLRRYGTIGHIAMSFPAVRFPPLDFLDTARTISPCGVPKPDNPHYTKLYVGESYNFTWRLQFPHQGGYRLSVLNETGDIIEHLAPAEGSEYAGLDDQITQYATVRLTLPCARCMILLERQALELGQAYGFRSCADVNILKEILTDDQRCFEHGIYENGKCKCRHLYSGDQCQYKGMCGRFINLDFTCQNDHCSTDEDCLNDGKCVNEPNALIKKTCYCAFGYFGQNCNRTFDAKSENDKCFNYNYPKAENSFNKYGLFANDCFKKTTLNEDDFVYSRVVRDELEIILDYKSTSWIAMGWRPKNIDRSCRLFPDLENSQFKRDNSTIQLHETEYRNLVNRNDVPVSLPKLPKNNGLLKSALLAPLHPMDCTDIVIGSVRDGRLRINDMYTRDRSTPIYDIWLDGEESFSSAYGIERDGRTIIMFRRRIVEIEPSDHPLGPGEIFVIYAKGQTMGSYSHHFNTTLDLGSVSDYNFYKHDELKYHGNKNRGIHPIEFVSVDEQPPSIRPPLRFWQPNSSSIKRPFVSQNSQSVLLLTTTGSEKTSSTAVRKQSVTKHNFKTKTESTIKNKLLMQSSTTSESESEPGEEGNFQENDYLYFDNGSVILSQSRLVYISVFLFLFLLYCYL